MGFGSQNQRQQRTYKDEYMQAEANSPLLEL